MAYRGKYPTRINGTSGTATKGVYLAYVNNGARMFFAARDAIAAGLETDPAQLIGRDVSEFPWLQATVEAAAARQTVTTPAQDAARCANEAVTRVFSVADDAAFFAQPYMVGYLNEQTNARVNITKRQLIERAVVRRAVLTLLATGYTLRIHDGEDWATERTADASVIMAALMACDEERLMVYRKNDAGEWVRFSSIFLVYGNDGWDVIADYGVNIEEALTPVNDYADALSDF